MHVELWWGELWNIIAWKAEKLIR